jgi:hypothetical protein
MFPGAKTSISFGGAVVADYEQAMKDFVTQQEGEQ